MTRFWIILYALGLILFAGEISSSHAQSTTETDTKGISDSIGTEVSGILGFSMLRLLEIKIDYRDGLVDFVWDPKRRF